MASIEEKLPVVFVHGIRVSGTMWGPVRECVGDRHPTAAPDLPGHGARRGEPFTMAGAVEAVAGAVDRLGGRALVAGLSLGGYVAVATAHRHPGRVAGLVAMGCTLRPRGLLGAAYRGGARLAAAHPEAADRLSAWGMRRALPGPPGEAMVRGGLSCEVVPSAVRAVHALDPAAALRTYPGPVWLVNGERDPFRRDERSFLSACREGRLYLLPRHGHLGPLADPAAVARVVLDAASLAGARPPGGPAACPADRAAR
ncbi:alpha/beta fold hydrolase [Streptomyces sp. NPDC018031]|uniref:alpha/beta fold hydrolase n=1 Tax=Streptomyces sp. NPDC018031 TaxID=3365033 RepID=UPI0037B3DDA6